MRSLNFMIFSKFLHNLIHKLTTYFSGIVRGGEHFRGNKRNFSLWRFCNEGRGGLKSCFFRNVISERPINLKPYKLFSYHFKTWAQLGFPAPWAKLKFGAPFFKKLLFLYTSLPFFGCEDNLRISSVNFFKNLAHRANVPHDPPQLRPVSSIVCI